MPLTSIVISMYNHNIGVVNIVDKLLFPSLLNNASSDKQLVLVDDVSPAALETQETVERFLPEARKRFGEVVFVQRDENLNFSKSYNDAAARADGKALVISNADVYFPEGSIDQLAKTALDHGMQVGPVTNGGYGYQTTNYFEKMLGGKHIKALTEGWTRQIEAADRSLAKAMEGKVYPVSSVSGYCFGIPRETFERVGRFDERFLTFWSDTDLSRKMKEESDVIVDGSVYVYHHDEDSRSNQPFNGNLKVLIPFAVDGLKYMWKWKDFVHTSADFAYRAAQNMFYVGTITNEIRENMQQK